MGESAANKALEPWLVQPLLIDGNMYRGFGTGSVVGRRWILTAGHIVKNYTTGEPIPVDKLRVAGILLICLFIYLFID